MAKTHKNYFDENYLFRSYCKELKKYPLLTAEEERELAMQVRKGNKEARNKLINSNLRLVLKIARKYEYAIQCVIRIPILSLMDLIQAGNKGLIRAVEKFDPEQGRRLTTYASWWVKSSIQEYLDNIQFIRLPKSQIFKQRRLEKLKAKFEATFHREPTLEEIVYTDPSLSIQAVTLLYYLSNAGYVSLNASITADSKHTYLDIVKNPSASNPLENAALEDQTKKVLWILELVLNRREKLVIMMRFGIYYERSYTLEELASVFLISRQRIQQIERRAINKLKAFIEKNFPNEFLS
ncbi:MAG: RNA polymerase sigma factor RpoD/SigA [Bacteroidia bacterium]|nr:RNA polymerase sigma factor RpoD/SigA [Bacteroidia bacterium]MDW8157929.1 RNA polymerase sigma factor RpoD/SigA [Bacteroidia bacterium]